MEDKCYTGKRILCIINKVIPDDKYSIEDMAMKTHITRVMLRQIINGSRNCSLDTAQTIVDYFNKYVEVNHHGYEMYKISDFWVPNRRDEVDQQKNNKKRKGDLYYDSKRNN